MRKTIFNILNQIYGILMSISFAGGVLPLLPFIFALCIGGDTAEKISVFIYNEYYPWVIMIGSLALIFGLAAMYVGKLEGLSIKKVSADTDAENEETK